MKKMLLLAAAAALSMSANAAGPAVSGAAGAHGQPLKIDAVLYDQNDNAGANGVTSQNFEASFDIYDTMAADDFKVPSSVTKWLVTQVSVTGSYSTGGPAASAHVTFYKGKKHLPNVVVADYPAAVIKTDAGGSFVITVPKTSLKPGTYWVSVQANQDFGTAGQWFWTGRTVQAGDGTAWQNPGDGFATGCTKWKDLDTCIPATFDPDLMFAIGGKAK